jgi:hypothetical protein
LLHPTIHIVSAEIESLDAASNYLLVQAGADFIGFASFSPVSKQVYGWVVYQLDAAVNNLQLEEKLSGIAAANPWVHSNYQKILLVQYAAGNVLLPAVLNRDEGKENLLELAHGPQQHQLFVKDVVVQQSLVNHYVVDGTLGALLNKRFPKGEWWHVQSLLLTQNAGGGTTVTATIRFQEVQITVEKNGQWLLLQSYHYHTPEDVLYYILNAMQQLELSQEETTVWLQGMIDQRSALYDVLYNYILNLKLKEPLVYQFPAATEEHPAHLSASLDQVLACVS